MTIEQQISELVTSSNQLTSAVENKVQEIDTKLVESEQKFDQWRGERDVIGDQNGYGTVSKAIFQGFVSSTDETIETTAGLGDFLNKVPPLGSKEQVYLHFKAPININLNSEMFWFNIKGYSYGSAAIINEIIVGYCYKTSGNLESKASFGNLSTDSYLDTSGNVILRVLVPNIYYTTIKIDTMRVGNGRLFNRGDLDVKLSLSDTVEF